MASATDYHIASEPDFPNKVNRHIFLYFLVFAVLLFCTILALGIMFRFQVQYEKEKKIGDIDTQESMDQVALSEAYLSGKKGLLPSKQHVSIDVAIEQFVAEVRRTK